MALTKIAIGDTGTVAKAKIDAAFDVVDINEKDIAAVESDIVDINAEIGLIKEDIVSIEEQQVLDTGDITTLKGDVADVKADIVTINSSISDINDGISSFNTNIENIHSYSELPNELKQTITIESNVNKRYIKKTATSQEVTIDTTTVGDGTANGTIEIMLYDGDLSFVSTTAIDIMGTLTYSAPAIVEVKLMQNYLYICDISAVGGGGGNLPPIDDVLYGMKNQEWTEIPESEMPYIIVDNIYEIENPRLGLLAYNTTNVKAVSTVSDNFPIGLTRYAMVGVGDSIYVFGGEINGNKQDTIIKIDIPTGTVTTLTETLLDGIADISAVALGTDIYLFSGYTQSGIYDRVVKFDTLLEQITDLGAGNGSAYSSITTDGTDIYLIRNIPSDRIFKYTVSTNSFNLIAFSPSFSINSTELCYVNGKVYMIGGDVGGKSDGIFEIDVLTGDVTQWDLHLENGMLDLKSCAFGDFIIFLGKGTIPQNKLLSLDTINKNILEVGYNLQNQDLIAFFKTKDDDSFIYFKYESVNRESVYRFNFHFLKEGVYVKKTSSWVFIG